MEARGEAGLGLEGFGADWEGVIQWLARNRGDDVSMKVGYHITRNQCIRQKMR